MPRLARTHELGKALVGKAGRQVLHCDVVELAQLAKKVVRRLEPLARLLRVFTIRVILAVTSHRVGFGVLLCTAVAPLLPSSPRAAVTFAGTSMRAAPLLRGITCRERDRHEPAYRTHAVMPHPHQRREGRRAGNALDHEVQKACRGNPAPRRTRPVAQERLDAAADPEAVAAAHGVTPSRDCGPNEAEHGHIRRVCLDGHEQVDELAKQRRARAWRQCSHRARQRPSVVHATHSGAAVCNELIHRRPLREQAANSTADSQQQQQTTAATGTENREQRTEATDDNTTAATDNRQHDNSSNPQPPTTDNTTTAATSNLRQQTRQQQQTAAWRTCTSCGASKRRRRDQRSRTSVVDRSIMLCTRRSSCTLCADSGLHSHPSPCGR